MIANLFSIPLYTNVVDNKDTIQQELSTLISKCSFKYNPIYRDSHKITDCSFKENILEIYHCNHFLKELHFHVGQYLHGINSNIDINIESYKVISWLTLNDPGDYTAQHNHSASDISGVYYIEVPEDSGDLFFKNPNKALISSYCYFHLSEVSIAKAVEGTIYLFPGWLDHGVLSNRSNKQRISLSFNIIFPRKLFL